MTRRQMREWEQGAARVELARTMKAEPRPVVTRSGRKVKSKRVRTGRIASTGPKKSFRKRAASNLFTFGAMVFAAAFMVGTTVPAMAIFPNAQVGVGLSADIAVTDASPKQSVTAVPAQTFEVSSTALSSAPARDTFGVTSYAEMLVLQYGSRSYSYSATTGAVRWPFPYAVPISSGYGDRAAPCRSCSSQHMGLDFTPGAGAPIYAIADGVVVKSEAATWGYGTHVVIAHTINGQQVESLYAHMQRDTTTLFPGMEVKVGDLVGLVGSTGTATGNHLHFEILIDGVQIDPFAWLQANAVN